MGLSISLDCMLSINRHRRRWLTLYSFTALEVLVIKHGRRIKILASFGLSSGYHSNRVYPQQEFLPLDTMPTSARVGPKRLNIADSAKDLLFGMKFGKDKCTEDLGIGRVCIQSLHDVRLSHVTRSQSSLSLTLWVV